jgi:O-antigen ligase
VGKPSANIVTSFFGEEKKLGSFIVRLLPFITSIIIISNIKILENNFFKKFSIESILLIVAGTIIFLTSERTAMFLYIFFFITSLRVLPKRLLIVSVLSFVMIILFFTQKDLTRKYINATLFQFQLIEHQRDDFTNFNNLNFSNLKYISEVHEKLIKVGFEIFKESPLTGSGVKTFEKKCNELKKKNPDFICSTHPHNTYIQIISDIGFFGVIIILFIFLYIFYLNVTIFFRKNLSNLLKSFYLLNLGIIINLMPFIPSGSFFNNWMNLMMYLPIGYWLYLYSKIKKSEINL